jgi:transposase
MQVSTIGVDLAKNVFQVHGVDNAGNVVITRQLRRKQIIEFFSKIAPCLVGMEACAGLADGRSKDYSGALLE